MVDKLGWFVFVSFGVFGLALFLFSSVLLLTCDLDDSFTLFFRLLDRLFLLRPGEDLLVGL